jgi:SOS response regulatory protein OraA/RecX
MLNNKNLFSPIKNNNNNIMNNNNNTINNNTINNNYINFTQINSKKDLVKYYQNLSLEELAKQSHFLAKKQLSCRYLQKKIEENPELARTLFFPNILRYIQDLSNSKFGHYYLEKLFQYLKEEEIFQFLAIIFPDLSIVSTNQYGTKVIQELVDHLKTEKLLLSFVNCIAKNIILFINDLNASEIIYKLISIENKIIFPIHEIIWKNVVEISKNKKGCSFLKKYFDTVNEEFLINIINEIDKNLDEIIIDQFGNYVIQDVITIKNKNNNKKIKENIINKIYNKISFFSTQKFSSNVIEKCFEDNEIKNKIIEYLLINDNFKNILLNNYGNYVCQKALLYCNEENQNKFFKIIVNNSQELQMLSFGQKLISKLLIQYPKLSLYMLNIQSE